MGLCDPGDAGIVVLAFIYFGILGLSRAGQKLQYTPADVVYGKKIHAVHGMDIDRGPQVLETIPANLSEEPVIRVSESFFDFGEVNSHIVLRRTFVIANTGQSALIIQGATQHVAALWQISRQPKFHLAKLC
jgi:hypothetical protein